MKVAVLGCGPAGLMVAHACRLAGVEFDIYSKVVKSSIGGAQFLHQALPEVTPHNPDGYVTVVKLGQKEVYAERVYGDPNAPVSWDVYSEGQHPVWNLKETYHRLWYRYEPAIVDVALDYKSPYDLAGHYDKIFSCIPAPVLCDHFISDPYGRTKQCEFSSQTVWITPGATCRNMRIVYNGTFSGGSIWYRQSRIFKSSSQEWSFDPGREQQVKVRKPISTDCPGPPIPGFHAFGRYGRWKKNVLTHDAFNGALEVLNAL